jgi:toxin ParE1/3/4
MARKTPRVVRHPRAILDVLELADFIARKKSLETADRFVAAAQKTVELLSRMPGLGTRWESNHSRLADLRFFPVAGFPKHLVFYRPLEDGLNLVRVLHGARDIASLLESDEEMSEP